MKKSEKNGVAHHVHFDLPKIEIEGILNSYEKHKHILIEISKAPANPEWCGTLLSHLQGGRSMMVFFNAYFRCIMQSFHSLVKKEQVFMEISTEKQHD